LHSPRCDFTVARWLYVRVLLVLVCYSGVRRAQPESEMFVSPPQNLTFIIKVLWNIHTELTTFTISFVLDVTFASSAP